MTASTPSNGSLAGEAYTIVRRRILRGELSMGQVVSRRKLASELGMSFLPVSEALLRLEYEGILESRPRAGTRIRIPSRADVLGNYVVREALEVQAAVLFTRAATPRHCHELMKLAAKVEDGVADDDRMSYVRIHHKLHRRIAEIAGCEALVSAIDGNNALASIWFCAQPARRAVSGVGRHQILVEALATGDASKAAEAVRDHLSVSLKHTLPLLKPYFKLREANGRTYARK